MKSCLLALTTIVLGSTTLTYGQQLAHPWQHENGAIEYQGKTYKTWRHFHDAGVLGTASRCGTPLPDADAGIGGQLAGLDPSDCTMSSTTISDAYLPSISDYRIPVVVHVLRNDSGTLGNLDFDMVQSGIDILNEDMNAILGSNGEPGNEARIEFYLADTDPDGNPTNGVTYTDNTTYYNDSGTYYVDLGWDTERYMNIYTNTAGGYLGYVAGFPADGTAGQPEDRVVVLWEAYGRDGAYGPPFDQGRTLTHEVGHYLGLFHTFQGGCDSGSCYSQSDLICDTNSESGPHFGCSTGTSSCGSVDPIENYMDYSDDLCMNTFTVEQVNRMRCSLLNYRPLLYTIGAACSTGVAGFGSAAVQPDTLVTVRVRDCDLNLDDDATESLDVLVYSDLDPIGFTMTLETEATDDGIFTGAVALSSTEPTGGLQALYAPEGTFVYVAYLDELDADENENVDVVGSARVDGTINVPIQIDLALTASSATIRVVSDEPVRISIPWGLGCGALTEIEVSNSFSVDQEIEISGLEDTQTYFCRLLLTDEAGNAIEYADGAKCITFTLPEAPDFYTEQFAGDFDLQSTSVRFVLTGGSDVYTPCSEQADVFPINPSGGTSIALGDDASALVSLPFTFEFYGTEYDGVYVGSNGYLTFGTGDTAYNESLNDHFSIPRIAPLFDDLNPTAGGTVSSLVSGDRIAITWSGVPEYNTSNSNDFQIILEAQGDIVVTWLGIDSTDSLVGLSSGAGLDAEFEPNDLSASQSGCLPSPPSVQDIQASTNPGTPVEIQLLASDDGVPGTLSITIESLPSGTLTDLGNGSTISAVPYALSNPADAKVRFTPGSGEYQTSFIYSADDGGTPPEGGVSNPGTVDVIVSTGPQMLVEWTMDQDPNWVLEGDWGWGQPAGLGGDPSSGATGTNVVGYNLNGQYGNNLSQIHATTPIFDCSGSTGTTLQFKRWLGVESSTYDHVSIAVSTNAGFAWNTIYDHEGASFSDTSWQDIEIDISEYADGESIVQLRWTMGTTDGSVTYCGWNLDDVSIMGMLAPGGIPGDFTLDGVVNGEDLTLLLSNWGSCSGCTEDITQDGFVGGADLTILLNNWSN